MIDLRGGSLWRRFRSLGLRAELRFCNDITGTESSLQHERVVVCATFADSCLRLAQ
jgi:hypothetical protein